MKHQECLLLTKSLERDSFHQSYIRTLWGERNFLLELIKQRELNSLRVVFMSAKKDKDYSHIRCKRSGNKYS